MTILFLARRFYPSIGGVETHVLKLSEELEKKGHRIVVISERENVNEKIKTPPSMQSYKIPITLSEKAKKFQIWLWFLRHINLIQSTDVVHCHDVFFWYLPFRFLFPKKPVFTTFHGYETYPIKKSAIFVRKISEMLSNGTICIGDFMKKWYHAKPTYVSYGGVSETRQKSYDKKYSALFFGRLDSQTGITTYIDAYKLLKKKYPSFTFSVIGAGVYAEEIPDDVDLETFMQNPQEQLGFYRFAFVSRYLSILEAMEAKRLVFAVYDNPIKKDYLTMAPFAPFIVIVSTAQEIVEKVSYYILHPNQEKELVEKAHNWVRNQTWENVAKLYLKLWNTVD